LLVIADRPCSQAVLGIIANWIPCQFRLDLTVTCIIQQFQPTYQCGGCLQWMSITGGPGCVAIYLLLIMSCCCNFLRTVLCKEQLDFSWSRSCKMTCSQHLSVLEVSSGVTLALGYVFTTCECSGFSRIGMAGVSTGGFKSVWISPLELSLLVVPLSTPIGWYFVWRFATPLLTD